LAEVGDHSSAGEGSQLKEFAGEARKSTGRELRRLASRLVVSSFHAQADAGRAVRSWSFVMRSLVCRPRTRLVLGDAVP
jgi:hypothetical protein